MESKLTTLAQKHSQLDEEFLSRKSIQWLQNRMQGIKNPLGVAAGIARETDRRTNKIILGHLYFFLYHPKTAKSLPYYDAFPLVLVLQKFDDGFLGLNFHYLPIVLRAAFLDKLMNFAKYDGKDDPQRIKVSYDILSSTKRYRAFEPCLKRYSYSQMGTKPLKVESNEWETALFLPIQNFKKAKSNKIWHDSINTMKNNNQ